MEWLTKEKRKFFFANFHFSLAYSSFFWKWILITDFGVNLKTHIIDSERQWI